MLRAKSLGVGLPHLLSAESRHPKVAAATVLRMKKERQSAQIQVYTKGTCLPYTPESGC